jgi:hypothetical protein
MKIVDGDRLLPESISLPSVSCNRSAYAAPESVLVAERPGDTCIAQIAVRDLPGSERSPGGVVYDWIAADDPLPENPAHAEVRLRRDEVYDSGHVPSSKAFRLLLKQRLAERFRVIPR